MKQVLKLVMCTLSLSVAFGAQARSEKVYRYYTTINFLKDKAGVSINMFGDGINIPSGYDSLAFGIKFVMKAGEQFRIVTRGTPGTEDPVKCLYKTTVRPLPQNRQLVLVDVNPSMSIDDGSLCDYLIQTNTKKSVNVRFYNEGT